MFDEYCRLFYGPAADGDAGLLQLLRSQLAGHGKGQGEGRPGPWSCSPWPKPQADAGSVYGRRLALVDDYLKGLRNKRQQLGQKRGPVPVLRLVGEPRDEIVIDGKLDDEAWQECPVASTGRLRELQTGRQPIFGTTLQSRCGAAATSTSPSAATSGRAKSRTSPPRRNGDQALWYGDAVEILLETDSHSYYQIAVSPSGAVVDLDRGAPKSGWFGWDSQAEVATQIADDHWTVEIRIPVVQDENDPLHQVIGRKPTASLPWHVNVCRQRIREHGSEYSAFSPDRHSRPSTSR